MSKRAICVVDLQNETWPTGNLPLQGIEAAAANAVPDCDRLGGARHAALPST